MKKLALTILRVVVGGLFFGHGTQKLFGWFDGHGLEGTAQFFEQIGLRPGRRQAIAAGATEAGGGALLALGGFTPLAAGSLIGVMSTAIRTVHGKNGPWVTNNGYEFNLVLIAALLALAEQGPGELSLDGRLGTEISGPLVGLAALAGGVAGATLLTRRSATPAAGEAQVPGDPAPSEQQQPEPAAALT